MLPTLFFSIEICPEEGSHFVASQDGDTVDIPCSLPSFFSSDYVRKEGHTPFLPRMVTLDRRVWPLLARTLTNLKSIANPAGHSGLGGWKQGTT